MNLNDNYTSKYGKILEMLHKEILFVQSWTYVCRYQK